MREAMFIKKNVEKWKAYQEQDPADPDEAAEQFITLMDDLAYAKTFYPRSKSTRWINGLAASVYQKIYRNRKEKYSRIFTFWKYELPLIIRKHHGIFLFTAVIFIFFTTLGIVLSVNSPEFMTAALPPGYVEDTEERIAKGDPFGVYTQGGYFNMFIRIAFNNISVAFKEFAGGLFFGIFTLIILWQNGLMLGAFQYMFFEHDLGVKSILVIWIHTTIEISSFIIAGAAGFILVTGVLFPGTYTRIESFKRNAKDAAKILICLIPFFLTAAFLESYITHLMSETFANRSDGMPAWVSILILAASLFLIVWYFIIWPVKLSRRGYFIKKDGIVSRLQNEHA